MALALTTRWMGALARTKYAALSLYGLARIPMVSHGVAAVAAPSQPPQRCLQYSLGGCFRIRDAEYPELGCAAFRTESPRTHLRRTNGGSHCPALHFLCWAGSCSESFTSSPSNCNARRVRSWFCGMIRKVAKNSTKLRNHLSMLQRVAESGRRNSLGDRPYGCREAAHV